MLALYTVTFSLGVVVLYLSILAFRRFSSSSFRTLAILLGSGLMLLLVQIIKSYERAIVSDLGGFLHVIYFSFSILGCAMIGWGVPDLAFAVAGRAPTAGRRAAHGISAGVLGALALLRELEPATAWAVVVAAGIVGVQAYGIAVLIPRIAGIANLRVRNLVRSCVLFMAVMLALIIGQIVAASFPGAPPVIRDYPFAEIAYFLGVVVLLLWFALRYLFKEEDAGVNGASYTLPPAFVQKYGISPRECEIIVMIENGYNNRKIGESLFISAITVKNHIYHIYRKTGASNKIQLLNLIHSAK